MLICHFAFFSCLSLQVGSNKLHLARVVMLNASQLRKVNISEAIAELDKAKLLLDNSIRFVFLFLMFVFMEA